MRGRKKVKGDYKVVERLIQEAIKLKEVLSANKMAFVNILGVNKGINLKVRESY